MMIVLGCMLVFLVGVVVGGIVVICGLGGREDLATRLVTCIILFAGGIFVFADNNGFAYSLLTGIVCGGVGTMVVTSLD